MVDLPVISDFTKGITGSSVAGGIGSLLWMLVLVMGAILFIVLIFFIINSLSYNVRISAFDGITLLTTKGKHTKKGGITKFKLKGLKKYFVVQPTDKHFYYEKPKMPFLPIRKHLFFCKVNDVLIPSFVNESEEGRNVQINVGQEQKDGTIIDMLLPLKLEKSPQFDASEINLRSFMSNELAWAEDTYKELKSTLMMLLPYGLVVFGMVISLLMIMFTLYFIGK